MPTKESSKEYLNYARKLLESSEVNYREGAYKEAIDERKKAMEVIGTESQFKALVKELSHNKSKYNLIDDYKMRVSKLKKDKIIVQLKKRIESLYNSGDYKRCIRSLRRIEKYY